MGLLVCCVFAYWLVKHLPEVAAETAQAIGYGLRGEESPAAAARRQRLEDAGLDPASGGAFGQFAGNVWRDFWLDQDQARARRRTNRAADTDRSWWQSLRAGFDEKVERQAGKWRSRPEGGGTADRTGTTSPDPSSDDSSEPFTVIHDSDNPGQKADGEQPRSGTDAGERRGPIRVDAAVGNPDQPEQPPVPPVHRLDGGPDDTRAHPTDRDGSSPDDPPYDPGDWPLAPPTPPQGPVRVGATVGDPAGESQPAGTTTAVLELESGENMTATVATRGIPVTGVVSGAAECLSIHRQLETAIAEFHAQLAAVAGRVHSMGEQTLGIVQFAGASTVVTRMAQAAEAIAATRAQATACGAEVGPLLMQTRSEFNKRNS